MTNDQASVKSHIQPQYFLKGFLATKENPLQNDDVFVYTKGMPFRAEGTKTERNPARTGVGNTGFVRNFYAFLKDDGTLDTETYENRLSVEIENPGHKVLRKIRELQISKDEVLKTSDFFSNDERTALARYIAGMYARTKRSRREHLALIQKTVENGRDIGILYTDFMKNEEIPQEEKDKFDRYIDSQDSSFDRATGRITLPPKFLGNFKGEMETNESFPESIFRGIDCVSPIISRMKWQFRFTPDKHAFFAGDDPVTWTDLKRSDAILVFPIASNIVFCGFNDQRQSESIFTEKNEKIVRGIRETFAEKCEILYYSRQAEWLVSFFNKRR